MKALLVGSGGREHALAWKLAQSPQFEELHAAPGNPGIAQIGACHPVRPVDVEGLLGLCASLEIDLVVIGPEAPLVAGVADELRRAGVAVFGPSRGAARLEGSKSFAKEVMGAAGVPAANSLSVARPPCVVKADGLAAGKGVFVCWTQEELDAALPAAAALGGALVIEELLEGEELSLFALCDGSNAVALAPAQDFKRIGDGDTGPNTGGMGSYSPVPGFGAAESEELLETVHRPVLAELASRGTPFVGLLYAGLMLTAQGPKVVEFNCRFGDPETQAILPLMKSSLLHLVYAVANGDSLRDAASIEWLDAHSAATVIAAPGYPDAPRVGDAIRLPARPHGIHVFHAGTRRDAATDELVTDGGRVLAITGVGDSLAEAAACSREYAERVSLDGKQMRRDIGWRELERNAGAS